MSRVRAAFSELSDFNIITLTLYQRKTNLTFIGQETSGRFCHKPHGEGFLTHYPSGPVVARLQNRPRTLRAFFFSKIKRPFFLLKKHSRCGGLLSSTCTSEAPICLINRGKLASKRAKLTFECVKPCCISEMAAFRCCRRFGFSLRAGDVPVIAFSTCDSYWCWTFAGGRMLVVF